MLADGVKYPFQDQVLELNFLFGQGIDGLDELFVHAANTNFGQREEGVKCHLVSNAHFRLPLRQG